MRSGKDYISFILEDKNKIKEFIGPISNEMYTYIEQHDGSRFVLFYKYLTHSDLGGYGKQNKYDSLNKNLLYYMSVKEMQEIQLATQIKFPDAHQSNIGLKEELYDIVGLPHPREDIPYKLNNYLNVYLVNKNMEYFTSFYTKTVFEKLGKSDIKKSDHSLREWDFSKLNVVLSKTDFTPFEISIAVHGLGMKQDVEFNKIRHHLFKGDILILLFELKNENNNKNNMFVMFEKNPIFFSVIGEVNKNYVKYQELLRTRLIHDATGKIIIEGNKENEEVTRQEQSAWRDMLAKEMMGYTSEHRQIFCPLTYITVDYDNLGSLFVASHIKGFSDKNTKNEEKYDINNGLLICANADALFDKHLITIGANKQIIFSFLLDGDIRLKTQLLLMQPIFSPIFNEQRMKYLAYHRSVFEQKEKERKKSH